jgi:hypothetical protein
MRLANHKTIAMQDVGEVEAAEQMKRKRRGSFYFFDFLKILEKQLRVSLAILCVYW